MEKEVDRVLLTENDGCIRFLDITFGPVAGSYEIVESELETWRQEDKAWRLLSFILKNGIPEETVELRIALMAAYHKQKWYDSVSKTYRSPAWMKRLPLELRKHLAIDNFFDGGKDGVHKVSIPIPYSHVYFMVHDDGISRKAHDAFELYRHNEIAQLSFLKDPTNPQMYLLSETYEHKRDTHAYSVGALALLLSYRAGLTEEERAYLYVAGLTHDAATAAGGDTMKLVDREAFDEERNYTRYLHGDSWEDFRDEFDLKGETLHAIVRGEHPLSGILDVADKITYTAWDVREFLKREQGSRSLLGREIAKFAWEHPFFADVWDTLAYEDGSVVMTDPDAWADFLTLRIMMFQEVYFNPARRFYEVLLGELILPVMYRAGLLPKEELLGATDRVLLRHVAVFLGSPENYVDSLSEILPKDEEVAAFATEEEALASLKEARRKPGCFAFMSHMGLMIKPGTKSLVRHEGRVMTLTEAQPERAAEMERLSEIHTRYVVYAFPIPETWNERAHALLADYLMKNP